jgi:hypothetical protein
MLIVDFSSKDLDIISQVLKGYIPASNIIEIIMEIWDGRHHSIKYDDLIHLSDQLSRRYNVCEAELEVVIFDIIRTLKDVNFYEEETQNN